MTKAVELAGYRSFLAGLKERIVAARATAVRAVNRELVLLYWDIGHGLVQKQEQAGWGAGVVRRLAADLRAAFPDMRGWSELNLWRMQKLYRAHVAPEFLSQAVKVLRLGRGRAGAPEILAQAVREMVAAVPWGHHANVLNGLSDPAARSTTCKLRRASAGHADWRGRVPAAGAAAERVQGAAADRASVGKCSS